MNPANGSIAANGRRLSAYELGRTAIFASRRDPRFSWCAYVPQCYHPDAGAPLPLAVLVHGSLRDADIVRDAFIDFAEAEGCILLAPLFPGGIDAPGELHNYKRILFGEVRYDLLLLDMIDEVAGLYRMDASRFLLFGFSGGGQFVHRFYMLHPERLLGVSVGAPGTVTLPDPSKGWWTGMGDTQELLGRPFDPDAMRKVAVQLVIGSEDTETWDVTVGEQSGLWMPGINDTGANRHDRLKAYRDGLTALGIPSRLDIVDGAGHMTLQVLDPVKAFFTDLLKQGRHAG